MQEIAALILAAGKGSRIGSPKYLLKYRGKTFIQHIYDNLFKCGLKNIVAVIRKEYEEWFRENFKGNYLINKFPEMDMLSSVILGIEKLTEFKGIMIFPVDHPHVKKETVSGLINSFNLHPGNVIKPVFENSSGHPVIIPSSLFMDISSGKFSDLNSVIRNSNINTIRLKTNDEGVLRNINTSEDLL